MRTYLFIFLWLCSLLPAADPTEIDSVDNYNGWGWHAYVMQNGLITTATMPEIGARIMQYDLDSHASIWINDAEVGNIHDPIDGIWYNYGGFKNWPAPQDRWSWTPPPILDCGAYTCQAVVNTADSVAVFVSSQVEQWKTPDLRFERRVTLYSGSTRLKVEQTLINERGSAQSWGVWDITQNNVQHGSQGDWQNFWVYFAINPDSKFGSDGVRYDNGSDAWKGEVAPGIYGVQFLPENKKIFADSHQGWICYVDERDSMAYAKTFPLFEGADYPDNGAHVEVWINGGGLPYVEVEVVSPIVELAANGGSYTFTEEWWAAKVHGPILGVNRAGAIAQRLEVNGTSGTVSGKFGIFHLGSAQILFLNASHETVGQGAEHTVTPLELFTLNETISQPEGTQVVLLRIKDESGDVVGDVDMIDYSVAANNDHPNTIPETFTLYANYPNPFNNATIIKYTVGANGHSPVRVELSVYNLQGQKVATLVSERQQAGHHQVQWDAGGFASGIYLCRLQAGGITQSRKMVLIR
jgi:hypothetical protein